MADQVKILCDALLKSGHAHISEHTMKNILEAYGLTLHGGSKIDAESHLKTVSDLKDFKF